MATSVRIERAAACAGNGHASAQTEGRRSRGPPGWAGAPRTGQAARARATSRSSTTRDLDRVAAEDLVAQRRRARSSTSPARRPAATRTPGRSFSARAGVQARRRARCAAVRGASRRRPSCVLIGGEVRRNGTVLADGPRARPRRLRARSSSASASGSTRRSPRSRRTRSSTSARRASCSSGSIELPPVSPTKFRDRHALIVVRGTTYHRDLRALRAYIARRPARPGRRRRRRRRDPRGRASSRT